MPSSIVTSLLHQQQQQHTHTLFGPTKSDEQALPAKSIIKFTHAFPVNTIFYFLKSRQDLSDCFVSKFLGKTGKNNESFCLLLYRFRLFASNSNTKQVNSWNLLRLYAIFNLEWFCCLFRFQVFIFQWFVELWSLEKRSFHSKLLTLFFLLTFLESG